MSIRAWLASFAIAATWQAAWMGSAHADDADAPHVTRAENYAEEAFEAYSRGAYTRAIELYETALESVPDADILYNLARIYDTRLKDRAHAIAYYERYSQDPGADAERLQLTTDRLLALREQERLATKQQRAVAAPTRPSVRERPSPELEPRLIARRPIERDVGLEQPDTSSHDERHLTDYEFAGLLIGGVGAASLLTGAGFGLAAKSNADIAHDQCTGDACRSRRGVDAAERGADMALISTVAFAAGAFLVAVGTGLLVFGPRATERDSSQGARISKSRSRSRAQLAPWAGRSSLGLQVASTF